MQDGSRRHDGPQRRPYQRRGRLCAGPTGTSIRGVRAPAWGARGESGRRATSTPASTTRDRGAPASTRATGTPTRRRPSRTERAARLFDDHHPRRRPHQASVRRPAAARGSTAGSRRPRSRRPSTSARDAGSSARPQSATWDRLRLASRSTTPSAAPASRSPSVRRRRAAGARGRVRRRSAEATECVRGRLRPGRQPVTTPAHGSVRWRQPEDRGLIAVEVDQGARRGRLRERWHICGRDH